MQSKLMNAAMTAFSRKGLNDCRMSDIADAAGLARGTAYLYFRSKEQLMLSMYKLYSSRIDATWLAPGAAKSNTRTTS